MVELLVSGNWESDLKGSCGSLIDVRNRYLPRETWKMEELGITCMSAEIRTGYVGSTRCRALLLLQTVSVKRKFCKLVHYYGKMLCVSNELSSFKKQLVGEY